MSSWTIKERSIYKKKKIMARWQLILLHSLAVGTFSIVFDYNSIDDPYETGNTVRLDCGTLEAPKMKISYRGDAVVIFAAGKPGCVAKEVEPAHFEIYDALTDPFCQPERSADFKVYSLRLVIQMGNVLVYNDPVREVTCNYRNQISGHVVASLTNVQDVHDNYDMYELGTVQDITQRSSNVTLFVRDVFNNNVEASEMGIYVQLVAEMDPVEGEVSFRILNCRAISGEPGSVLVYSILINGCGDGNVIQPNRGFFTYQTTRADGTSVRIARSVYFQTFSLLRNQRLEFECDYAVTSDNSTDGKSCLSSNALK